MPRPDLSGYNDVASRLRELRQTHPDASVQPVDPANPFQVVTIDGATFIAYAAACYRTPDDPRPGIGVAWEPFPGKTNYTRDSELQNAETSAWGRAIIAAGAGDAQKIASANEVANRENDRARPQMTTDDEATLLAQVAAAQTTQELRAGAYEAMASRGWLNVPLPSDPRRTVMHVIADRKKALEAQEAAPEVQGPDADGTPS